MADFEKAIPFILKNEGGYVNHPNDPGGATNFGISLRFLRKIGLDIDQDGDIDADDIKSLNGASSSELYRKYFWEAASYSMIDNQAIATKVFDLAVNMGASRANKILQKSANIALRNNALAIDGIIGNKTIQSINSLNNKLLEDLICQAAAQYYSELANKNPKLEIFLTGWLKRANKRYGGLDD
ncbi:glycoside hydrolase family 108 protein [Candidatus Odyssella acanthamoebae]|uniref:Uncharacterized protein n=1 Tax=Candidatus Odyssella acanthamoebae TaxID=91604 RepID=A0A077AW84_9PROT|nr:glycosyl hydrolase 108 family protein [Candidatus Paracaedibacter acanthamoebae]AIK95908.1 hypothetical protein ID47_02915 [Candidatus Paracaedibacter acanthamoebae]